MQMICDIPVLLGKWNSHANFIHTSHLAKSKHSWVIDILCQSIRELSISQCHQLYRNTFSNYTHKHNIKDHYMNYISFSFFQDHFVMQS